MDGRLALGAAAGAPVLFLLLAGLTTAAGPLAGWALGLVAYWAALGLVLWRRADPHVLAELAQARWPGWLIAGAMALPVVVLGALTLRLLGRAPLPEHLLLAAAIGAVANGALEELFWRGALLPRPTPRAAALALGLFAAFHLAWAGAWGLDTGAGALGPLAAVLAALVLGGAWTASRLATGTVGAAILGHAAFNLFAFAMVAARN